MKTNFLFLIFLLAFTQCKANNQLLSAQKKVVKLMGSRFELTAVAENDTIAWDAINKGIVEITRIEKLISSWDANSQTSLINQNAGVKPVRVDKELYDLIFRSKKISKLTNGAFDISFASMDGIWKFDGSMTTMPNSLEISTASQFINWKNIVLDSEANTVFLKKKGMKIGFGAIGKGYAANKAMAKMKKMKGVRGGLVNAGGDLISWGENSHPDAWTIKITNPTDKNKSLGWLNIDDMAVVTSGDYERFFEYNGKRYAHIIDPRTGYPTTGIKSVTIVCPDAEVADALATSVFVLGQLEGLELINQLVGIECLIITDDNKIIGSERLKLRHY